MRSPSDYKPRVEYIVEYLSKGCWREVWSYPSQEEALARIRQDVESNETWIADGLRITFHMKVEIYREPSRSIRETSETPLVKESPSSPESTLERAGERAGDPKHKCRFRWCKEQISIYVDFCTDRCYDRYHELLVCCVDGCYMPTSWVRATQFAGDHPFCSKHAQDEEDFGELSTCKLPPANMWCSRPAGHSGPCPTRYRSDEWVKVL